MASASGNNEYSEESLNFGGQSPKCQAMGCCSSNHVSQIALHPDKRIQPVPLKDDEPAGLSNIDIEIIQENWKSVSEDLQGHGITLFRRLFDQVPEAMTMFYFAHENDCDLEKVMADQRLQGHALNVMNTISVAVSSLHDLPELVPVLKNLGAMHAKFKLQVEHYEAVGSALLWTLEQGLGEGFTDKARRAWACVFDVVAKNMREGSNDVEKQEFGETGETRAK